MTKKQAEKVVARWVKLLKVEHWEIDVVWPEDYSKWPETTQDFPRWGDDAWAAVYRTKDYEVARVYINPAQLDKPNRLIEIAIIHEILHIVSKGLEHIVDLYDGMMHRDVDSILTATFKHEVEGVIDKLAFRFYEIAGPTFPE